MTIKIEVFPSHQMPPALNQEISSWYRQVFSNVDENGVDDSGLEWQGSDYRILVWQDGKWGAIVGVLPRTIHVGEQAFLIGGVGGVMSLPHMRGKGLAKVAMRHAIEFICADLKASAGMLYCAPETVPFYASLGWQTIERQITHHQSDGARVLDTHLKQNNAMIYPCGDFTFPAGDVDVKGKLW